MSPRIVSCVPAELLIKHLCDLDAEACEIFSLEFLQTALIQLTLIYLPTSRTHSLVQRLD